MGDEGSNEGGLGAAANSSPSSNPPHPIAKPNSLQQQSATQATYPPTHQKWHPNLPIPKPSRDATPAHPSPSTSITFTDSQTTQRTSKSLKTRFCRPWNLPPQTSKRKKLSLRTDSLLSKISQGFAHINISSEKKETDVGFAQELRF